MSKHFLPAVVLVVALGWAFSFARQKDGNPGPKAPSELKPEPKVENKDDGPEFELRMLDGTFMKVVLLDKTMLVATRYGQLTVPVTEIRRLELGFRYPDGVEERVAKAVNLLGSDEFQTREDAEKQLLKAGVHAIPTLRRALNNENPEVVHRTEAVLKKLEGKLEEGKAELNDYDLIETTEFTAKGRLTAGTMSVRTKYFGQAVLKFTDVRSFMSLTHPSRLELSLEADKYAKVNQAEWMETPFTLHACQQLIVAATGKVDQWPAQPGQYMVGPEGLTTVNVNRFGQGGSTGLPGQVIGRIGPGGKEFPIGASYKNKVTESGKLYLRIGASPWNCPSSGSYKVVVDVVNP
jgi:hypothetical protein